MAAKNKPYEQFGPYILFKKLEADALGELWRAAAVDGEALGPLVALRRFTHGSRDDLATSAAAAARIAPLLMGSSFVRQQTAGVIDGTPFLAHEYGGGRSLRHIIDKARGASGTQPNPMPIDQAIVIAEKVALSLATTADLRFEGNRLSHGALLPQFVWITDDGEIRVAGQQFGPGVLASLRDPRVAAEIGRWFPPESQASGIASRTADVWSMGALLFLLVTGVEPPDGTTASAFAQVVRAAKTVSGTPIPDDIRVILDHSLTLDVNARYQTAVDMKQAISALAHSGKYSATSFNLAFYVSTLLKKEHEGEALERERESKVNITPYVEALAAPEPEVEHEADAPSSVPPMFAAAAEASARRSRVPLAIAAVVVVAAIGAGAFLMLRSHGSVAPPAPNPIQAATAAVPKQPIVLQPLVAAAPAPALTTAAPTDTAAAAAAEKAAFEAAVQQKLQEEMMKLQADYTKKLQQSQSKQAPLQIADNPASSASSASPDRPSSPPEEVPSAAQLDQQRLATRSEPQSLAPQQTQTVAQAPAVATAAPAPQVAAAPVVREGDVIDLADLDAPPHVTRAAMPVYPPMALRQKIATTVLITALISETGEVADVKILRGDERFGFNDAAVRAVRGSRFSPAMKDGKRVKTWYPIPVQFKQ